MNNKKGTGLIFILVGVVLLLDRMQVIDVNIWQIFTTYWPVLVILLGISQIISKNSFNPVGFVIIFVGVSFLLLNFEIINLFKINLFFPILLVLIGIMVIWPKNKGGALKQKKMYTNASSEDYFSRTVILGDEKQSYESNSFIGGDVKVVLGSFKIDLSDVILKADTKVYINLTVVLGNVKIIIPNDWEVEIKGKSVLADFKDLTENRKVEAANIQIYFENVLADTVITN